MSIFNKLTNEYDKFDKISESISSENIPKDCDKIYSKYCEIFKKASYLKEVEWNLRHYNASKKILLSVLFLTQTRYLIDKNLKNLAAYTLYYSLFNAYSSNLFLLPHLNLDTVNRVSHSKVFKHITNTPICKNLYGKDSIELFDELKLMREVYSYHLPLGGTFGDNKDVFDIDNLLNRVENLLPLILQTTNMLSYFSYYAWEKNSGKIDDEYIKFQAEVDEIFFSFIEHHDYLGKYCLIDDDDYRRQGCILQNSPIPIDWFITEKLCEDLECGWFSTDEENYEIIDVARYLDSNLK